MKKRRQVICFHCGKPRKDIKPGSPCPKSFHGCHNFGSRSAKAQPPIPLP